MKTIKCGICKKDVQVEDSYPFKTCEPCRFKLREKYRLEQTEKELEQKSLELLKSYGLEPTKTPKHLWNFSNFAEWFKLRYFMLNREATWEDYVNEVQIQKQQQTDYEMSALRLIHKKQTRELKKFLRFDLFEPSVREKCEAFRLTVMTKTVNEDCIDHINECVGCQDWMYNLTNYTLTDLEGNSFREREYPKDAKGEPIYKCSCGMRVVYPTETHGLCPDCGGSNPFKWFFK